MTHPLFLQNPAWLNISGLRHGFSTRAGGVSEAPYASLNLKYPTGQETEAYEAVLENRRRLGAGLSMNIERLVACRQCHGAGLYTVKAEDAGRGAFSQEEGIADTDGLITAETDLPLLIQVADCLPILLVEPVAHVIGAVHAGWRGTQAQILRRVIERMQAEFGAQADRIQVAIGPGIGFEQFEVGTEVAEAFADHVDIRDPQVARVKGEKVHLDLVEINRRQALRAGIQPETLFSLNRCTVSEPELFFSFRRDQGLTGRLGGLIAWAD
ncbi:peptidoglycan editing factor PgeF [bacterium (Candidatus Blackallbacteria) CG17_big_fil_post_rev_8_21_14_2_50_48_46]|uniref:Purine nucleoside phosphorylase n=1 Tax=bacterium (Candidatus Blackallbacteria) CG17_big_fil_post_rev_8_21_14_2_50_48_46 TaxID=2014261 RepID=A0A2M7G6S3_9BACT|nr:MAG: multicopper polyphenol oxidase [bacterium (Candidatus Blackallbacteria) CG18_big_fil_WC_8_21_14_2_50_49_26]PIW17734.1 MAG: peptidoglycan editing factor PgeF [bacterium (Candidatus Blackallbacteria) CG17_big_fil_post_rev_8_21_14_2_50_48_46]PIW47762.1 MAG: peptidoglycan editing factor PgeF [bacterium (Candidatus Blackallbacteria) CG13_big_fil_rev_8_21_14_2_50_49_14]